MNACAPDDLSAYMNTPKDAMDLVSATTVVADADDSSSAPSSALDGDLGMQWNGPDPMD